MDDRAHRLVNKVTTSLVAFVLTATGVMLGIAQLTKRHPRGIPA